MSSSSQQLFNLLQNLQPKALSINTSLKSVVICERAAVGSSHLHYYWDLCNR